MKWKLSRMVVDVDVVELMMVCKIALKLKGLIDGLKKISSDDEKVVVNKFDMVEKGQVVLGWVEIGMDS